MANSRTDIANLALARIGVAGVADIDDPTNKGARFAKLHISDVIREVGRAGDWNCLRDRVKLAPDTTAPSFGWAYQFTLPGDCLRVNKVNGDFDDSEPGDDFEVEQGKLLCDAEEARIKFNRYNENVAAWDALFTGAVVTLLASRLAYPVAGDVGLGQSLLQWYQTNDLPKARQKSGAERKGRRFDPRRDSRLVGARYIGTNGS